MSDDKQRSKTVCRSQAATKANYDRLSWWYDHVAGWGERRAVAAGLDLLAVAEGETALEIGHGTGRALVALARAVGKAGRVVGVDFSEGMHRIAAKRIERAGLSDRVELNCADVLTLTYRPESFDAAFISFTLELFEPSQIPGVLALCRRALRPGGRLVVVSMQKTSQRGAMVRLYEWAHAKLPTLVDCRPIEAATVLTQAGFTVSQRSEMSLWGLPVSVVLASKP